MCVRERDQPKSSNRYTRSRKRFDRDSKEIRKREGSATKGEKRAREQERVSELQASNKRTVFHQEGHQVGASAGQSR